MIPGRSGLDVCRDIRKRTRRTPILMLTAKGQEVDKVVGLEVGADDYIVSPSASTSLWPASGPRCGARRAARRPRTWARSCSAM